PALLAGPVEGRGEPARRVERPRTRELDVVDHVAGAFARQHDHVLPRCLGAVAELHGDTRDAAARRRRFDGEGGWPLEEAREQATVYQWRLFTGVFGAKPRLRLARSVKTVLQAVTEPWRQRRLLLRRGQARGADLEVPRVEATDGAFRRVRGGRSGSPAQ